MNVSIAAVLSMVPHTVYLNTVIRKKRLYFYKNVSKFSSRLQGFIYILTSNNFLEHSDELALQIRNKKCEKSLEIS